MFLSMVIPVYNVGQYLEACVNACLDQDLNEQDYEIICVNDGSTDNSLEILERIEKDHGNLHVYSQDNAGVSAARNCGLAHARGEYIWFIDGDDLIAPHCLGKLKSCREDAVDIFSFSMKEFRGSPTEELYAALASGNCESTTYHGYVFSNLFKRSLLTENHILFHTEMVYAEDELFYVTAL